MIPEAVRLVRALVQRGGIVTRLGWTVLGIAAAAWLGAWWTGWAELTVLCTSCLAVVVLSTAFTLGRPPLVASVALRRQRVVAGDSTAGDVVVENRQSHHSLPARLEAPVGDKVVEVDVPGLAALGRYEEPFLLTTSRRGVVTVGPVAAVRGDPLGLIRREIPLSEAAQLFVHPRTVGLGSVSSGWLRDLEGQPTTDPSLSDVAFHTLRDYVPGDDRRHIHQLTSARMGKLMVRQFVDTRRSHLALVLSTNANEYGDADEFELAVSVLASIGLGAFGGEQEVTCVAGVTVVPAFAAPSLLDGLCHVEMGPGGDLRTVIQRALPHLGSASIVAFVTGRGPGLGVLRSATDLFGMDVRVVAIRCELGAPAVLRHEGMATFLTIGNLDELARSLRAVARR